METVYDFSNPNTEYIYSLHPKSEILLHIKRQSNATANLYFTNQLNKKIDIWLYILSFQFINFQIGLSG